MREILFRGKRIDNGEWVEGFYCKAKYYATDKELCDYITVLYPDEEGRRSDHFMIDSETRGQYTGLTDKNGVKIFEGDIIRERIVQEYKDSDGKVVATDEEVSCGVVKFGEYSYLSERFGDDRFTKHIGFYVDWVVKNTGLRQDLGFWANVKWCDVFAGNIHDNPEVLEEDSEYQFEQWCRMNKE